MVQYSNVSNFDPTQEAEIKRRRLMAEALQKQAAPKQTEVIDGYAVPQSGLQGLNQGLSAILGAYAGNTADTKEQELIKSRQALMAQAIEQMKSSPKDAAGTLMQDPSMMKEGLGLYGTAIDNETKLAAELAKFDREKAQKSEDWDKKVAHDKEMVKLRQGSMEPYADEATGQIVTPQAKLSATQQKELFDTIDAVNANKSSKTVLSQAQSMNDGTYGGAKPFSGFGSQALAFANRIPLVGLAVDDKRATATTDYNNLVSQQALGSLKEVFGGNPTEGERKILLQMQALPSYNESEQKAILANAQAAADRRLQYNQTKAKAIQTGSYSGLVDGNSMPTGNTAAPAGAKVIGTSGGKKVYQLPDGTHVMEQ